MGERFETSRLSTKSMKLEQGWVAEVLRMPMLAPDIIEAVLDGKQLPASQFANAARLARAVAKRLAGAAQAVWVFGLSFRSRA